MRRKEIATGNYAVNTRLSEALISFLLGNIRCYQIMITFVELFCYQFSSVFLLVFASVSDI